MRIFLSLLLADLAALRGWFSKQTASKLLVGAAFILLLLAISRVVYSLSWLYFRGFNLYKEFGLLTASYLVNASIVILFWFILVTTVTSMLTFLLTKNVQTEFLLTLPFKQIYLTTWNFFRTSFLNIFLLLVTLTPIMLAFAQVFLGGVSLYFIFGFIFMLFVLVCFANSIGGLISFAIARLIKNKGIFFAPIGAFLFLTILLVLIQIIFPHDIFLLSEASLENFWSIYNLLPLNNPWFPSYLLTLIILGNQTAVIPLAIFSIILAFFSLFVQSKKFIDLYQSLQEYSHQPLLLTNGSAKEKLLSNKLPVFYKDWLSIIRSPSETSYGILFILFAAVFFAFLSLGKHFRFPQGAWERELVLFSFIWLSFFTTAYLLRVVFPLMAREGSQAWYIFSLPLSREKVLLSKIYLGLVLSIPQMILAIIVWNLMSFITIRELSLPLISLLTVICLSLVSGLLGAVMPNFQEGNSPENVSTSLMGLATLGVAILVTGVNAFLLHAVLNQILSSLAGLLLVILILLALPLLFAFLAYYSLKSYQF